ncbi:hypothetical protein BOTBODRAFT_28070 [Botryobasidium botryosum FD-172 SS1]|uniref:hydroxyacylglutathione hydrolase n=1 Tax=Botryobasidium botryosum (strain FD-172 SS1) TaxID=930990 RepID=A0A067MV66_BOTB1|nr:hypothetical protein BOTBODRAFT_28070 [Botryobasidium botryosum FD-172 SS1]
MLQSFLSLRAQARSCTSLSRSHLRSLSSSAHLKMRVVPVPVRSDNYAYLLIDENTNKAAVVDPFDVSKVKAAAVKEGVELISLLTTHHHQDHSGGNNYLAKAYPTATIYGGSHKSPAVTDIVKDGDAFTVGNDIKVKCMATPCHTQDSICYYVEDATRNQRGVFTGDTLFVAGCGRFFEGTAEEMHKALSYLGTLPDDTTTYVGHEYTKGNLAFGAHVEPENPGFEPLKKLVENNEITAGKSTIADEKKWNVFMRLDSPEIQKAVGKTDIIQVMDELRNQKNNYRG